MRTVANITKNKSIQMGNLAAEGKTFVEIPENYNAIAYILNGKVTLNENFSYKSETLLHFRNDGSGFSFKTVEFQDFHMKRTYMVEFELPESLSEEFLALIPEQRNMVDYLMSEGKIRSYSLAMDRSVLWVIMEADSEFEVMETIAQLPLSDHMHPYISELMFHNTADLALHFSMN